ncbi:glycoside hydrolase family 76 protein [Epithele typhae]|uniref:glycoside hydrolase family 76 protein n=1 Tax=Epithele typhae TaxID=378194 RepID=UPI002008995F|nr:glycoside hydrolase family 76 protein [Epithele typhae]KAH9939620.1 glycoside hydrolase family 76 protein [Epithele typhae]
MTLALAAAAFAQDLGVPLSWREFTNNRSHAELISISEAAIDTILPQLNVASGDFAGIGYWQAGNVWSAMANEDFRAGTTKYKAQVVDQLNNVFGLWAHYDQFGFNDDAMWWATAAYYGFRAYGDTNLLSHAEDVWTHVNTFVIPAGASSISTKNFGFSATCEGKSMAGGVFWRTDAGDDNVNSVTTGLFITLSAYLAEVTGDAKYTNAAIASANWIRRLNLNSDPIVLDTVHALDCSRTPTTWLFTYNTGKYLEGLEVLYDVTKDTQWRDLAVSIGNAGMKSTAWAGSNGVCTEGASPDSNNDGVGFKAIWVRAIDEAYNRVAKRGDNEAYRILLHSYVDVQLNALLELAANGTSYSSAWAGPPQGFTTWGQLASLDVFVAALHAA